MVLKWITAMLLIQSVALWACGLATGGRGTIVQALKVAGFLSLIDVLAYVYVSLILPPVGFLVGLVIPVMCYLAVKSLHEYQNDDMAFRVTCTGFFIFYVLCLQVLPRLGLGLHLPI
jgi:hypothetical protein